MNTIISLSRRLGALLVAIVAGGSTSAYRFEVDAVKHPADAVEPRFSYRLVPASPDTSVDEWQVRHVARDVATALSSKGLFEAPHGVAPELDIEFDFGLEGPIVVTRTHTEPVFRRNVVQVMGAVSSDDSGSPTATNDTWADGTLDYVADREVEVRTKEFRKFLRLTARVSSVHPGDEPSVPVWSVFVENQDKSDDLGKYVRFMTAAAKDVIGEDTATKRSVEIRGRDGRVLFVQTGFLQ